VIPLLESTFGASKNPEIARALARLMSDISERCCSAGWLRGNEFDVWSAAHGELTSHAYPTDTEISDLLRMHEMCGGWVVWHEKDLSEGKGASFVSTEEWLAMVRNL
jgi:hypothetical protein